MSGRSDLAIAAPAQSQTFMLVGAGIITPIISGYTDWAYWVFCGNVSAEGRH